MAVSGDAGGSRGIGRRANCRESAPHGALGARMTILPVLLYIVAAVAYAYSFGRRSRRNGQIATSALAGAVLIHTFVIV